MVKIVLDKDHISYKSAPKIKEICKPIFEKFDISFLRYVCAYQDRSRFVLATDHEWIDKYFEMQHYLYEFVNFENWPKDNFSGTGLWSGCDQDHRMCRIWKYFKEHRDFTHNLIIYQKRDNICELYDFFTKENNYHAFSNYLTSIDVFKHFTYYFKEKAKDIIKVADANRFKVPKDKEKYPRPDWMTGLYREERAKILESMHVKRYHLTGRFSGVFISEKELDCLRELIKGKTQEEIGLALNISRRTVEYRLNNLKSKLQCQNQGQLVQRAQQDEVGEIIGLSRRSLSPEDVS